MTVHSCVWAGRSFRWRNSAWWFQDDVCKGNTVSHHRSDTETHFRWLVGTCRDTCIYRDQCVFSQSTWNQNQINATHEHPLAHAHQHACAFSHFVYNVIMIETNSSCIVLLTFTVLFSTSLNLCSEFQYWICWPYAAYNYTGKLPQI